VTPQDPPPPSGSPAAQRPAPVQGRGELREQPPTGRQPGSSPAAQRRNPADATPGRKAATAATAFAAATTLHLAALAAYAACEATPQDIAHVTALATKPLLMPLLAAYAVARGAPRGLMAALLCGWAGDILLEVGGTPAFMAGMGCFAAGHLCYLRLFAARGAFRGTRSALGARYACYGLVWAVMITLLRPGLDPGMRVPVAVYSLLLTAMAAGAFGLGRTVAAGGALFLLSDTLIATGIADWPQPPGHQVLIMLTYAAAQALLAAGILAAAARTAPARAAAGAPA
jgi:uncharacterized membrane protein YhhN